jgi:hypothetical protein
MSKLSFAIAFVAALTVGCGSSTTENSTPSGGDTDSGTTPAVDAGTTPSADAGSAPTTDAGAGACTTKTYANFGQAFVQNNCNGCHAVATPRLTSLTAIKTNIAAVKREISAGTMPQGRSLSSQEKADVLEWLNCGAP